MKVAGVGFITFKTSIYSIHKINKSVVRIVFDDTKYPIHTYHLKINIKDPFYYQESKGTSSLFTYDELSKYFGETITEDNIFKIYFRSVIITRFSSEIPVLLEQATRELSMNWYHYSTTINCNKFKATIDCLYLVTFETDKSEDTLRKYKRMLIDFVKNGLNGDYKIGNYKDSTTNVTKMSDNERKAYADCIENNRRRSWILGSKMKLVMHNGYFSSRVYEFKYNYYIIGDRAMMNFTNLETLELPSNLQYIGESSFENCFSLNEISFPMGLLSIGEKCFKSCEKLKEIVIPESVKEIGNFAFDGCKFLTDIYLPKDLEYLGYNAFPNYSDKLKIHVKHDVTKKLLDLLTEQDYNNLIIYDED